MIRNWKTVTLYSLLSAATVVYVPQAAPAGEPNGKQNLSELEKRVKALEDKRAPAVDTDAIAKSLEGDIAKIEKSLLANLKSSLRELGDDVKAISKTLDTLKMDVAGIKDEQFKLKLQLNSQKTQIDQLTEDVANLQKRKVVAEASPSGADKTSIDEIRSRLNAIQDAIAKLAPNEKAPPRLSMSMPSGTNATSGRVMLMNLYPSEVSFIVNGSVHRVPPNSHKMLDFVPTGTLSYEVFASPWGLLDRQATTLAGGETFTLTAKAR